MPHKDKEFDVNQVNEALYALRAIVDLMASVAGGKSDLHLLDADHFSFLLDIIADRIESGVNGGAHGRRAA